MYARALQAISSSTDDSTETSSNTAHDSYTKMTFDDIKWTSKCRPPVQPSVTKCMELDLVTIDNGDAFKVYSETCSLDGLIDLIVTESNRYAMQQGQAFETNSDEIKAFLGLVIFMGYHCLPSARNYWSTDEDLQVGFVTKVMTLKRFEKIKRFIHFNNNATVADRRSAEFDRAYKVRPVLNFVNSAFQKARAPEKFQSIDERMIKFKGHNIMRQYIRNKPVKWGFKMWMRCGSISGYTYQMDMYTGKKTRAEVGLGENVVLDLSSSLIGSGCHIFMDNFFTSPKLLQILHYHGLGGTGTVRQNRSGLPQTKQDRNMKKGEVQSFQSTDQKVNFIKWMDTKAVHVISNCEKADGCIETPRRQKGSQDKISVHVPVMVKEYNKYMGGVDLSDQLKSYYAIDMRCRYKYYLRVIFDIVDTTVVNGYLNFKKLNPQSKMSHLEFRQEVVRGLICGHSSRKYKFPSAPIKRSMCKTRLENCEHLPNVMPHRKRCKYCTKRGFDNRSRFECMTCDVPLCIQPERNCFGDFHLQ